MLRKADFGDRSAVEVKLTQPARIAQLIVEPMMGQWRFFHTPEHIFDVGGNEDAIEVMAALFHDIVYVQVDRSINFNVSHYITLQFRFDRYPAL